MNGIRIAMWSGPRNLSTAMMRAFENRHDTVVADEPFYAHYLYKSINLIVSSYNVESSSVYS